MGFNDLIDIRTVYNASFFQSEHLDNVNQVDSLLIDFGYVTTPAVSRLVLAKVIYQIVQ